ncbi:MAG: conserved rane protein of unknown function [Candidatus Saccharibacteria bacterium]|nr:conserved rane protein of unknown function [Candidatus Saccharibacteria bacterium]
MEIFVNYLLAGVIFAALDAVWLVFVANRFYKSQLDSMLRPKPNFVPAVIFYLLYILGIVIFALDPALGQHSFSYALGHGALLGLIMYATYDLTNHSTLKKWPAKVTYVDLVWGTCATAFTTVIAFLILN